jgi:hypothetical protein
MALPVNVGTFSTAVAPVGPFRLAAGYVGSPVVKTSTTFSNSNTVTIPSGAFCWGQTFLATNSFTLTDIRVVFSLITGFPVVSGVTCEVRAGSPTGTLIGSSTIPDFTVTGTSFYTLRLDAPIAGIVSGNTYAFVFYATASNIQINGNVAGGGDDYPSGAAYGPVAGSDPASLTVRTSVFPIDFYLDLLTRTLNATDTFYFFGRNATTATTLTVLKSLGSDVENWISFGSGKTGFTTAILNLSAYRSGDVVHMLVMDGTLGTSQATKYVSYDLSTDTFLATTETVAVAQAIAGQTGNANSGASLIVRQNGEVVALYNGLQTKVSGTNYARVYYRRRTGVNTWSAEVQVDNNTAVDHNGPVVAKGPSNRVHFLFSLYTSTNTIIRTLTSANVLGTYTNAGAPGDTFPGDAVAYDRSGTTKVVATNLRNGQKIGYFNSSDTANYTSIYTPSNFTNSPSYPKRIGVDGTDVTVVYRSLSDSSLYAATSTDDGASFSTPVLFYSGTITNADANLSRYAGDASPVYTHGTAVVLPYMVNEGGTWKYNEYTIRTTGPNAYTLTGNTTSFGLAGSSTLLARGLTLAPDAGAFAWTGVNADLTPGVAANNYTLTVTAGAFNLAGYNADLARGLLLAPTTTAFNLGGTTTALTRGLMLAATTNTFNLAGVNTNLTLGRTLTATTTTFNLTGSNADLARGMVLAPIVGSFAVSGNSAELVYAATIAAYTLSATTTAFNLAGSNAVLAGGFVLAAGVPNDIVLFGGGKQQTLFGFSDGEGAGQSFTSVGTQITAVTPYIAEAGDPTDGVVAKVWTSAANLPGTLLGSSTPIPGSAMAPTTSVPLRFDFPTPVAVDVGTQYVVTFTRTGAVDSGFYIAGYGNTDFYVGGQFIANGGFGAPWTNYPQFDGWITIHQGTPATQYLLVGRSADFVFGEAPTGYVLTATTDAFNLAGSSAQLTYARSLVLSATAGSFALNAGTAELVYAPTIPAYTLSVSPGALTISGSNTNLAAGRGLVATVGGFTLAGSTTSLLRGLVLATTTNAFNLAGTTTGLLRGYPLTLSAGAFNLNGTSTDLALGRSLAATVGSITLTGTTTGLIYAPTVAASYTLSVSPGAFSLNGSSTDLVLGRSLTATAGNITLAGANANLVYAAATAAYTLTATAGAFSLNGSATLLTARYQITAAASAFNLTGTSTSLVHGYTLVASANSFAWTGTSTALMRGYAVVADTGAFTLTGNAVNLTATLTYRLTVSPAPFLLTGKVVELQPFMFERQPGPMNFGRRQTVYRW